MGQAAREQGILVDGIGVQGHLHGDSFDPATLQNSLNRLAQFIDHAAAEARRHGTCCVMGRSGRVRVGVEWASRGRYDVRSEAVPCRCAPARRRRPLIRGR